MWQRPQKELDDSAFTSPLVFYQEQNSCSCREGSGLQSIRQRQVRCSVPHVSVGMVGGWWVVAVSGMFHDGGEMTRKVVSTSIVTLSRACS